MEDIGNLAKGEPDVDAGVEGYIRAAYVDECANIFLDLHDFGMIGMPQIWSGESTLSGLFNEFEVEKVRCQGSLSPYMLDGLILHVHKPELDGMLEYYTSDWWHRTCTGVHSTSSCTKRLLFW